MSHHRYLLNLYFDPDLQILTILFHCQEEAQDKVNEATRHVREIERESPRQFAKDAIGID